MYNSRLGCQYFNEAKAAADKFHFFTQEDGTQVFDILSYRVAQTTDGMVRWVQTLWFFLMNAPKVIFLLTQHLAISKPSQDSHKPN